MPLAQQTIMGRYRRCLQALY